MDKPNFIQIECTKDEVTRDDLITLAIAAAALTKVKEIGYESDLFDTCIKMLDVTGLAVESMLREDSFNEDN